jgi:hypothetical protein
MTRARECSASGAVTSAISTAQAGGGDIPGSTYLLDNTFHLGGSLIILLTLGCLGFWILVLMFLLNIWLDFLAKPMGRCTLPVTAANICILTLTSVPQSSYISTVVFTYGSAQAGR